MRCVPSISWAIDFRRYLALGFRRCIIPAHVKGEVPKPKGLELISVKNVREASWRRWDERPVQKKRPTFLKGKWGLCIGR